MWEPLISEEINSNQKLREYAEIGGVNDFYRYKIISRDVLKKEIERLIGEKEEGWLYKVKELINKKENSVIKAIDDELWLVDQLCQCFEKEREEAKSSIFYQCNSLQQVREIFQITVFYLTRIELDMEKELYENFLQFIKEWNLSPEYIAMVIKNRGFCNKLNIGKKLVKILHEHDEVEFGEELMKDIMRLGG